MFAHMLVNTIESSEPISGDYYVHHYAKAGETGTERMRDVGGLIDYHNTGYHDWYGGWAQAEYSADSWSAVLSGAQSVSRYQRQEQYNETEGDEFSKVLIFPECFKTRF